VTVPFEIESNSQISLTVHDTSISLVANGRNLPLPSNTVFKRIQSFDQILGNIAFATPKIIPGLRSLRGPDYPLIPHSRLKSTNPSAEILIEAIDPADDDVGTGAYKYPSHPYFKSGTFDLLKFTVSVDDSNAYFTLKFKALSNPGWHPEYGFQLTYVAIAIDVDGVPNAGRRLIPQNANYMLDERHAFERLILVGGGVQVQDTSGRILAAYIPTAPDVANPLGNALDATIAFAIPLSYLGRPDPAWTFTVLSGGQDDHGGAGIGEFRTVNKEPGEWNGGGRITTDDANVYDVVVGKSR
jgi:carbohydrate-binding DOMON domain-containing protein